MILWILVIIIAFATGVAQNLIFMGIIIGGCVWITINTGIPFWIVIIVAAGLIGYLSSKSKNS